MIELVASIIRYVVPVGLAATGETVGQKAGVINVGLEGMMLGASFVAMLVDLATGNPVLGLAAAAVTGLILGMGQAWFTLKLGADMVVAGTALNLLAQGVTGTLYRVKFGGGGKLVDVARLPQFGPWDGVMILTLVLVLASGWALTRTNWGLITRAAGEYPDAVKAAGFGVNKVKLVAVMIGSMLAGLGGGYLSLGVVGTFSENLTAGRGFLALAMVTFGRWKPIYVFLGALAVGIFDWAQFGLQAANIGVPSQLLQALPYVLALSILFIGGKGARPPAALGVAYTEEG